MIENLLFSVNQVAPYFLLIVVGAVVRISGIVQEEFFHYANGFIYRVAIPASLFLTITAPSAAEGISPRLIWFSGLGTVAAFAGIWLITELIYKDKSIVGTLVQGAFRGNFVLLGLPLAQSVAGPGAAQKAAFVVMLIIPIYNILSVTVLTARGKTAGKLDARTLLHGVIRSPMIITLMVAMPFFLFHIPIPDFAGRTLNYIGQCATPVGLLAIGGLFNLKDATARLRPALYVAAIKNLIQPAVLLPIAFAMGFGGEELMVLLVLFAAPAAISSYQMAYAMGGDGPLASNILIITTVFSAFFFALGIYILRSLGLV